MVGNGHYYGEWTPIETEDSQMGVLKRVLTRTHQIENSKRTRVGKTYSDNF